jgi:ankyrin repeat protein
LHSGAKLGEKDNKGRTVIHRAAAYGKESVLRLLIERGLDLNRADSKEKTPLHVAAGHDQSEAIRLLIQKGALIKARNSRGHTPLFVAATKKSLDAARTLLDNGANIEARDAQGNTCLEFLRITNFDHEDNMIKFLVARGASYSNYRKRSGAELAVLRSACSARYRSRKRRRILSPEP